MGFKKVFGDSQRALNNGNVPQNNSMDNNLTQDRNSQYSGASTIGTQNIGAQNNSGNYGNSFNSGSDNKSVLEEIDKIFDDDYEIDPNLETKPLPNIKSVSVVMHEKVENENNNEYDNDYLGEDTDESDNNKSEDNSTLEYLPLEKIKFSENNPFRAQDDTAEGKESLQELANSIAAVGIIHPPTVNHIEGEYYVISGERRIRAMRLLGWKTAPCFVISEENNDLVMARLYSANIDVRSFTPWQMLEYTEQLTVFYKKLIENKEVTGTIRKNIAEHLHISERQIAKYIYIKNRLSLLYENEIADLKNGEMTANKAYNIIKSREKVTEPSANDSTDTFTSLPDTADKTNDTDNTSNEVNTNNHGTPSGNSNESTDKISDEASETNNSHTEYTQETDTPSLYKNETDSFKNSDETVKAENSDSAEEVENEHYSESSLEDNSESITEPVSVEENKEGIKSKESSEPVKRYALADKENKPVLYSAHIKDCPGYVATGFLFADNEGTFLVFPSNIKSETKAGEKYDLFKKELVCAEIDPKTIVKKE